jgi:hypothetical protein
MGVKFGCTTPLLGAADNGATQRAKAAAAIDIVKIERILHFLWLIDPVGEALVSERRPLKVRRRECFPAASNGTQRRGLTAVAVRLRYQKEKFSAPTSTLAVNH